MYLFSKVDYTYLKINLYTMATLKIEDIVISCVTETLEKYETPEDYLNLSREEFFEAEEEMSNDFRIFNESHVEAQKFQL